MAEVENQHSCRHHTWPFSSTLHHPPRACPSTSISPSTLPVKAEFVPLDFPAVNLEYVSAEKYSLEFLQILNISLDKFINFRHFSKR